jgi:hypothetical protein
MPLIFVFRQYPFLTFRQKRRPQIQVELFDEILEMEIKKGTQKIGRSSISPGLQTDACAPMRSGAYGLMLFCLYKKNSIDIREKSRPVYKPMHVLRGEPM